MNFRGFGINHASFARLERRRERSRRIRAVFVVVSTRAARHTVFYLGMAELVLAFQPSAHLTVVLREDERRGRGSSKAREAALQRG